MGFRKLWGSMYWMNFLLGLGLGVWFILQISVISALPAGEQGQPASLRKVSRRACAGPD